MDIEKFSIGQVWKYESRSGEENSTITILDIEQYDTGDTIIHIRVDGIHLHSPGAASGFTDFIGHLPFSASHLSDSLTEMEGYILELPDYADGYNQWKAAWENGRAGYWKVDLKTAIEQVDKMMQSAK